MQITIDGMCKILGIETPDDRMLHLMDYCECETEGQEVWDASLQDYRLADQDWTCNYCASCEPYRNQVKNFFQNLLEKFDMDLSGNPDDLWDMPYTIIHKRGWTRAAKEIIEVINGYGLFHFASVSEAIRISSCNNTLDFVKSHMHWIPTYFEVYEGSKAKNMFERTCKYM